MDALLPQLLRTRALLLLEGQAQPCDHSVKLQCESIKRALPDGAAARARGWASGAHGQCPGWGRSEGGQPRGHLLSPGSGSTSPGQAGGALSRWAGPGPVLPPNPLGWSVRGAPPHAHGAVGLLPRGAMRTVFTGKGAGGLPAGRDLRMTGVVRGPGVSCPRLSLSLSASVQGAQPLAAPTPQARGQGHAPRNSSPAGVNAAGPSPLCLPCPPCPHCPPCDPPTMSPLCPCVPPMSPLCPPLLVA